MNIGAAACKIGVSDSTLRQWERELFLQIPRINGVREYSDKEINLLNTVKDLRNLGKGYIDIRNEINEDLRNINKAKEQREKIENELNNDFTGIYEYIDKAINSTKEQMNGVIHQLQAEMEKANDTIERINNRSIDECESTSNSLYVLNNIHRILVDMTENIADTAEVDMVVERHSIEIQRSLINEIRNNAVKTEKLDKITKDVDVIEKQIYELAESINQIKRNIVENKKSIKDKIASHFK